MFDTISGPIPVRGDRPRLYSYASAWDSYEKPNSVQTSTLKDGIGGFEARDRSGCRVFEPRMNFLTLHVRGAPQGKGLLNSSRVPCRNACRSVLRSARLARKRTLTAERGWNKSKRGLGRGTRTGQFFSILPPNETSGPGSFFSGLLDDVGIHSAAPSAMLRATAKSGQVL